MEYLFLRGSSVIETSKAGSGAVTFASRRGHDEVIAVLLDYGAQVDQVNVHKRTPLHHASCYGRVSTVKLLLERGADASAKNSDKHTALYVAGCGNMSQKEAVERVFQEFMKQQKTSKMDGKRHTTGLFHSKTDRSYYDL